GGKGGRDEGARADRREGGEAGGHDHGGVSPGRETWDRSEDSRDNGRYQGQERDQQQERARVRHSGAPPGPARRPPVADGGAVPPSGPTAGARGPRWGPCPARAGPARGPPPVTPSGDRAGGTRPS